LWGTGDDLVVAGANEGLSVEVSDGGPFTEVFRVDDLGQPAAIWAFEDAQAVAATNNGLAVLEDGFWALAAKVPPGIQLEGDIWGADPSDVYLGGTGASAEAVSNLLHFNGSSLEAIAIPEPESLTIHGVWGEAHDSIFAVGLDVVHCDGPDCPPEDPATRIFLFDGQSWQEMPVDCASWDHRIHGADGEVFVVGDDILHFDGSSWAALGMSPRTYFASVWAAAADDVYVTNFEELLHFDGEAWESVQGLPQQIWLAVDGNDGNDVYALGTTAEDAASLFHFDGTTWSETAAPPSTSAQEITAAENTLFVWTHGGIWTRHCEDE
jgi:hypothetical protein